MTALVSSTLGWVWQGLLLFLLLGLAFSAVVGLALALRPHRMIDVHRRWSRWVETDHLFRKLDVPLWRWEPWFYRYHRIVGALIAAGAGYVLWQWAFAYSRAQTLAALAPRMTAQGLDWLAVGLEWAVVVTHAGALLVGLVILVRPSLLKGLEFQANQWLGVTGLAERLNRQHDPMERAITLYPRVLGVVVLCASALCLLLLFKPVLSAFA